MHTYTHTYTQMHTLTQALIHTCTLTLTHTCLHTLTHIHTCTPVETILSMNEKALM